jgi:hypothetical protein
MLPREWRLRLVDLNVRPLADADLHWADYVFPARFSSRRTAFPSSFCARRRM